MNQCFGRSNFSRFQNFDKSKNRPMTLLYRFIEMLDSSKTSISRKIDLSKLLMVREFRLFEIQIFFYQLRRIKIFEKSIRTFSAFEVLFFTFINVFTCSIISIESISLRTGTFVTSGQVGATVLACKLVVALIYV